MKAIVAVLLLLPCVSLVRAQDFNADSRGISANVAQSAQVLADTLKTVSHDYRARIDYTKSGGDAYTFSVHTETQKASIVDFQKKSQYVAAGSYDDESWPEGISYSMTADVKVGTIRIVAVDERTGFAQTAARDLVLHLQYADSRAPNEPYVYPSVIGRLKDSKAPGYPPSFDAEFQFDKAVAPLLAVIIKPLFGYQDLLQDETLTRLDNGGYVLRGFDFETLRRNAEAKYGKSIEAVRDCGYACTHDKDASLEPVGEHDPEFDDLSHDH